MEAKPSKNQKEQPMKKWQQKPMEQEKAQQEMPRQPEKQQEPWEFNEFGDVLALFQRRGCLTTKEELGTALRSLGYDPTDEELQEMIDEVSDGEADAIDISYFLELMSSRMKAEGSSGRLKTAFAMFDKDQNGFISVTELRNALKNMGENLSENDLNRMIRLADVDEDGQVDYQEFVNMMMAKN